MKLSLSGRSPISQVGCAVGFLAALAFASWAQSPRLPDAPGRVVAGARTPDSSLSILPVRLFDRPMSRLSEVVGLLLEKKGMTRLELAPVAFAPALDSEGWLSALREYVRRNPPGTDYVLYAELTGTREVGVTGLRAALADAAGNVVWTDRVSTASLALGPGETAEPLTLALRLANDLAPQFRLDAETERDARPGKFAALMEQRSGLPPVVERAALLERQRTFAELCSRVQVAVYPARIGSGLDTEAAAYLARRLAGAGVGATCAVAAPVKFDIARADPNAMKALWDLARAFRAHLRQAPSGADYSLYVEYAYMPERWEHGLVHFVLCDARGEWVIVDLQNVHHEDYRAIRPRTKEDCGDLVVRRLQHAIGTALHDASINVGSAGGPAAGAPLAQLSLP